VGVYSSHTQLIVGHRSCQQIVSFMCVWAQQTSCPNRSEGVEGGGPAVGVALGVGTPPPPHLVLLSTIDIEPSTTTPPQS